MNERKAVTSRRVTVLDFCEVFMAKHMKDMNAEELENFIKQQEQNVARLNVEKPGSPESGWEAEILSDAKGLLADMQKKANPLA